MIAVIKVNIDILTSDKTDVRMKKAFGRIDVDDGGTLDLDEMKGLVTEKEHQVMEQLFKEYDLDGNGTIDFDEFKDMILRICKNKNFEKVREVIYDLLEE